MSTVFQVGDQVRLVMLPITYGGTREELQALIGLEAPIKEVLDGGKGYILHLAEQRLVGGKLRDSLPVDHRWVEAILNAEELK